MSRSSPGVRRIAAILNFIADHPGQSFVLTDIVRALKLSRATCHALLTGLVEEGYLYRSSDKSYMLGSVLARIGRSVADHFSPLQVAQPEMRQLADAFDVVCSAHVLEGDAVVVRERAASASHVGYTAPVGTRIRVKAQSLAIFYAWADRSELARRLESLAFPPTEEQLRHLDMRVIFARDNGFVLLLSAEPNGGREDFDHARNGENADAPIASLSELDPQRSYPVASILAPVFDERKQVAFVLGLSGFEKPLAGNAVLQAAEKLQEACTRIGNYVAGERRSAAAPVI